MFSKSVRTRIIAMFGKGGVGKTTCSAALATKLAEKYKVLIITNDPTPALSDIYGVKLRAEPTQIKGYNLYGVEISSEMAIQLWKKKFGDDVYQVLSSILPVDESIIDYVAGAPMISDEFIPAYLLELWKSNEYDFIVWDTAPAGGTLRLIKLEQEMYEHLGSAAKLYLSMKSVIDKISRKRKKSPLKLIEEWKKLAEEILQMVSSPQFHAYIVTIPEWLGLTQAKKIYEEMTEFSIHIKGIIVNQVASHDICDCEFWSRRAQIHKKYTEEIFRVFEGLAKTRIELQRYEIKGLENLKKFSEALTEIIKSENVKI
ncbi:MAG: ArsA family ATPase [Candidatus Odinarchaeota archaeon]|nr:ArsA family ATPase [Candidatus Odinarchaeota archaeon]